MSTSSEYTKRCTVCNVVFPATLEFFHKMKRGKFGLSAGCKTCRSASTAKYHADNPQKVKAAAAKYKAEHKEEEKTRLAKYQSEHPEKFKAANAKYRAAHPEKAKATAAKWQANNPNACKAKVQRRRARKSALPASFTTEDWKSCLAYFDHRCAVCSRPAGLWHTLAADHWIALTDPRSDNPGTVPTNIIPLCHGVDGCNNLKSDKNAKQWLVEKFGERETAKILSRIHAYFDSLK